MERDGSASPAPGRGAWPWIVAALALTCVITGGIAIALVVWPVARVEEPSAAAAIVIPEPAAPPEPLFDPALMEVEAVPEAPEENAPVAPEPAEPIARRARRARELTPSSAPPLTTPSAPPSSVPPPSAGGPPAGVQDAVAHMGRSDWRGCIRAARAAPRSPEILGARMSCALRAEDHDELRATCREMRAHYPSHPQTQSCASILRGYGLEP